ERLPCAGLGGRHCRGNEVDPSGCESKPRVVRDLVDIGRHDSLAVVVALMKIEVALVHSSELELMIPAHQRQIVAQDMVLAMPEPLPGILGVDVIWNQRID